MKQIMLCDFDGTLVNIDTAEYILSNCTEGNWRQFDVQLELGEITLEECLSKQFSGVKIPITEILHKLVEITEIRANYDLLLDFCDNHNIKFIIVSAGLDFVIHHFLNLIDLQHKIEVYSAKTQVNENGITFTFPKISHPRASNFKEDLVDSYKENNYFVNYIGDGLGDFQAIMSANRRFTVRNSKLANLCNKHGIKHYEFDDFKDVMLIAQKIE
jgi:2,3-diketo-5-methylthio-1-phosphopentane phosphatase